MNCILRLRPSEDLTIEELQEPYLWFSKPTEYKDVEDSNIFSFINNNESIKLSFDRIYKDFTEVANLARLIGICCFTKSIPRLDLWKEFPKGHNGIFVEYDKEVIESHFVKTFGLGNCFKEVEYSSNPTLFKSLDNNNILWNKNREGEYFKPLKIIEQDPRLLDQLFLKMFTRINKNFVNQNEVRIILGGRNIPTKNENIKGYRIRIPTEAIQKIYTHPNTPKAFIKKLKNLDICVSKKMMT
jgi:hypothetical protein